MALHRVPVETWQMILRYTIAVPVSSRQIPLKRVDLQTLRDNMMINLHIGTLSVTETLFNKYARPGTFICCASSIIVVWSSTMYFEAMCHFQALVRPFDSTSEYEEISTKSTRNYLSVPLLKIPDNGNWRFSTLKLDSSASPLSRAGKLVVSAAFAIKSMSISGCCFLLKNCRINEIWEAESLQHRHNFLDLTSLAILSISLAPLMACDLPSLKHLSIFIGGSNLSGGELLEVLKAKGKKLITFFDHSRASDHVIPEEIWKHCPKIEQFQTGLKWPINPKVPSSLHTVFISPRLYENKLYDNLPQRVYHLAGIHTFNLGKTWSHALDAPRNTMMYVLYAMNHGLTIQDVIGMSFQDAIVKLLQHRKKPSKGFFWSWNRNYFGF